MFREIHEYQIKAIDFVMLMCCYSKLGDDVLLIRWHKIHQIQIGILSLFLNSLAAGRDH